MDYEKKYKEALEWMQSLYSGLHGATKEEAEKYFPELKENKSERVRKGLIKTISSLLDNTILYHTDITKEEALAWLEKQGEQTHAELSQSEVTKTSGQELSDKIDVRTMAAWQSGYNEGIAKSRWISVEDELPKDFKIVEDGYYAGEFEESDIVMVAFDDGDFGFARYVHDFPNAEEGEAWYWFAEGNLSGVSLDDGEVTHWMPLPAPPKKGGEE